MSFYLISLGYNPSVFIIITNKNDFELISVLRAEFDYYNIQIDGVLHIVSGDYSDIKQELMENYSYMTGVLLVISEGTSLLKTIKAMNEITKNSIKIPIYTWNLNINYIKENLDIFEEYIFIDFEDLVQREYYDYYKVLYPYYSPFLSYTHRRIMGLFIEYQNISMEMHSTDPKELFSELTSKSKYFSFDRFHFTRLNFFLYTVKNKELKTIHNIDHLIEINPLDYSLNSNNYYVCEMVGEEYKKVEKSFYYVGLVLSLSGVNRMSDFNVLAMLSSYIFDFNTFQSMNSYFLNLYLIDYKSNLSLLKEKIIEVKSFNNLIGVFGCLLFDCKDVVYSVLSETKIPFFYFGINSQNPCKENLLQPGKIASQYKPILKRFLDEKAAPNELFLLVDQKSSEDIELYHYLISSFQSTDYKIEKIEYSQPDLESISFVMMLINRVGDSRYLIDTTIFYNTIILYDTIYKYFSNYKINIIMISCPSKFYESKNIDFTNLYCISSTDNKYENHAMRVLYKYTTLSRYTEYSEIAATAIDTFLCLTEISNDLNNLNISLLISNCTFSSSSGIIVAFQNHYFSKRSFIFYYDSTSAITLYSEISDPIEPTLNTDILGSLESRTCSINQELVDSPSINILVTVNAVGKRALYDKDIGFLIESLGRKPLELGSKVFNVIVELYDIASDDSKCFTLLSSILKENSIMFTSASSNCINSIAEVITNKSVLMFLTTIPMYDSCNPSILFASRPNSELKSILDWSINKYNNYIYICSSADFINTYLSFTEEYLIYLSFSFGFVYCEDIEKSSVKYIIDAVQANVEDGIIYYYGTYEVLSWFLTYLTENDIYQYEILVLNTEQDSIVKTPITYYKLSSYYPDYKSEENELFKEMILSFFGESSIFDEKIYIVYCMYQLWQSSYELEGSEIKFNRTKLYNTDYICPMGKVQYTVNNKLNLKIFLFEIKNGVSNLVYSENHYEYFKNNIISYKLFDAYYCDVNVQFYTSTLQDIKILVIASLSGSWKSTEESFINIIKYYVDIANNNNVFQNGFLIPEFMDSSSTVDGYLFSANQASLRNDISGVFISCRDEILQQIEPFFNNKDVIVFHSGLKSSESCHSNILSAGPLVTDFISLFTQNILPFKDQYIIVNDDTSTSTLLTKIISKYISNSYKTLLNLINIKDMNEQYISSKIDYDKVNVLVLIHPHNMNGEIVKKFCQSRNIIFFGYDEIFFVENKDCLENVYSLNTFFDVLTSKEIEENNDFYNYYKIYFDPVHRITSDAYGAYTNLKIWERGIIDINSFLSLKIRDRLFGVNYQNNISSTTLSESNYFSHKMYLGLLFNHTFQIFKTPYVIYKPLVYHPFLNNEEYYLCNIEKNMKKELMPSKKIALVLDSENEGELTTSMNLNRIIYNKVDEINSRGGILSKYIILDVYYISTKEILEKVFKKLVSTKELVLILGCLTNRCRDAYKKNSIGNVMLFSFDHTLNAPCDNRILSLMPPLSQLVKPSIEYLVINKYNSIILLHTNTDIYLFLI